MGSRTPQALRQCLGRFPALHACAKNEAAFLMLGGWVAEVLLHTGSTVAVLYVPRKGGRGGDLAPTSNEAGLDLLPVNVSLCVSMSKVPVMSSCLNVRAPVRQDILPGILITSCLDACQTHSDHSSRSNLPGC